MKELKPQMDLARLAPQPKMITAKNAEIAETEKVLFVFFAFLCGKNLRTLRKPLWIVVQMDTDKKSLRGQAGSPVWTGGNQVLDSPEGAPIIQPRATPWDQEPQQIPLP